MHSHLEVQQIYMLTLGIDSTRYIFIKNKYENQNKISLYTMHRGRPGKARDKIIKTAI